MFTSEAAGVFRPRKLAEFYSILELSVAKLRIIYIQNKLI